MSRHSFPSPRGTHADTSFLLCDVTDVLWYAALLFMPVDGTVFGVQMPYWSPIAPALFLAYAVCNARLSLRVLRRFPILIAFIAFMLLFSAFDWLTVGVNAVYLIRTMLSVLFAVSTLISFTVAWSIKHLPMRNAVTVLIYAYGFAFLFGVFTWIIQPNHCDVAALRNPLMAMYLRPYYVVRPQFLFAEPSYIGMHLFGVLLPMYWISRDRRLSVLIGIFAAGSLVMGAGVRIVLDSAVAGMLCLISACPWRTIINNGMRNRRLFAGVIAAGVVTAAAAIAILASQPRLQMLLSRGLFAGDTSMSARIFRSVAPLFAGIHDITHLLFGFGAGNLAAAMERGYANTLAWYQSNGGMMTQEIRELRTPLETVTNRAGNVFTMNLYTSFIAEFGLLLFVAAVVLFVRYITQHHAWNKTTICWLLLLAYLYAQFEAYAFYALPLFLWAISTHAVTIHHSGASNHTPTLGHF
ncbi:hypothetical protein BHAP_0801 [Bifidobacterium hapali]|uniref:Uncharacterized protein n=1 Tax=Bifidobacterium hapali TaxID=1630172 RepID=A0A261G0F7_9BIFI|nr:hypothetical protein [Bifidobacterium hapali]OZG64909.1 hypothetical protein BHAP_0801 [Bifidobacterium hapali]